MTTDGHRTTKFQTLLTSPWFTFPLTILYPSTGKRLGFTIDSGKFHNVSLGQGQETVAEMALEKASKGGHWVILQVSITFSWKTLGTNTGDGLCRAALPNRNDRSWNFRLTGTRELRGQMWNARIQMTPWALSSGTSQQL